MKDIGYEVHRIMEANHMVKKDVADRAGVDRSYLTQLRSKPDWSCSMLEKVCGAIGVSPSYFFDDFDSESNVVESLTGDIHNSSVSGDANVSVGNRGVDVANLYRIINHQERIIERLMKMCGLDDSVMT